MRARRAVPVSAIAAGGLGLLLLAALAAPMALHGATPAAQPAASGTPQSWAASQSYGTNNSVDEFGAQESESEFDGSSVTVTATNTSASTVQVETNASATFRVTESLCAPSCAAPTRDLFVNFSETIAHRLVENLTSSATVDENGTAVPALGVTGASESLVVSVAEEFSGTEAGSAAAGGQITITDTGAIAFSSPLGLVPWTLPNSTGYFFPAWNSSAPFTVNVTITAVGDPALDDALGITELGAATGGGAPENGTTGLLDEEPGTPVPGLGPSITCYVPETYSVPGWSGNGSGGFSHNNTTVTVEVPSDGGNCSNAATGVENATGFLYPFYGYGDGYGDGFGPVGPSPAPWPSNGSYGTGPPPRNGSGGQVDLALAGPYLPGFAVTSVLPGSAFFGGALRNLSAFFVAASSVGDLGSSGSGSPIGAPSGGYGGGGSSTDPPSQTPVSDPVGSDPSGSLHAVGDPSTAASSGPSLLVVAAVAAVATLGVALLAVAAVQLRRRERPPNRP